MPTFDLRSFVMVDKAEHGATYEVPAHLGELTGLPMPQNMLTALYGRSSLSYSRDFVAEAELKGKDLIFCLISVDAGPTMQKRVDIGVTDEEKADNRYVSDLADVQSLDIRRARKRLQDTIERLWDGYLADDGLDANSLMESTGEDFPKRFTRRPDLIARLASEPMFKHVTCFIYPVQTEDGKQLALASVTTPDVVMEVSASSPRPGVITAVLEKDAIWG